MNNSLLHTFFSEWEKGKLLSAFQQLLPNPESVWDSAPLSEENELLKIVENYVDASLFSQAAYLVIPNLRLQYALKQHRLEFTYPSVMACLIYEANLLHVLNRTIKDSPREDLLLKFQKQTTSIPLAYSDNVWKKMQLTQELSRFEKQKPVFSKLIQYPHYLLTTPWHCIRYKKTSLPKLPVGDDIVPVIFLEPYDVNYSEFLDPLSGKAAIFVFETSAAFFQMLQFPDAMQSLSDPLHLVCILELYPNEQLKTQKSLSLHNKKLQAVALSNKPVIQEAMPLLLQALHACLLQPEQELSQETQCADWLYQLSKRILFKSSQWHLGISRAAALLEAWSGMQWIDPYKRMPLEGKALGPEPYNFFEQQLAELAAKRSVRPLIKKDKIKVAHIVPQIVDGGHAPTRLLKTLIDHHDKEHFQLTLICTERMIQHFNDYPLSLYISEPSSKRAPNFLNNLKDVSVYMAYAGLTYEQTAKFVSETLAINEVDIAVFHGPDVINTLSAQTTDVPIRVLFEHGTPPSYPGFDSVILSSIEAASIYEERFKKLESKGFVLPFAVDVKAKWTEPPPKKMEIGAPEDSFVMTTISFHLNNRLSTEMCQAIGEILQRNPNTYYMPMGPVESADEAKLRQIFEGYGVNARVKFLGTQANPGQLARCMDIYLNEFPFGSCLGILDAMASGIPVVSMYDETGPQQARYGGVYMGIDKVITSRRKEDYVTLACRLIQDKQLYEKWSKHALEQYEKHADVQAYVKKFEDILRQIIA
jgi:glycosyltransferase involved in cell wall biosynthesis